MTRDEWMASQDPAAMLAYVVSRPRSRSDVNPLVSDRKLRLVACACVRPLWYWLDDPSREAVGLAERWADGEPVHSELYDLISDSQGICRGFHFADASAVAYGVIDAARRHNPAILPSYAALLREIVGDPFRPHPPLHHHALGSRPWVTADALSIARVVYDDRAFGELPVLADALEEAGCDSEAILTHLRSPGPHARGCWALDLVLGLS